MNAYRKNCIHRKAVNMAKSEIEKAYEEKFGKPMSHKPMSEADKKLLEEAYARCWDYDPTDEEVRARYSDDFNEWCDNF